MNDKFQDFVVALCEDICEEFPKLEADPVKWSAEIWFADEANIIREDPTIVVTTKHTDEFSNNLFATLAEMQQKNQKI